MRDSNLYSKRTIIYGCGSVGREVLEKFVSEGRNVVALVDNDTDLVGSSLLGVPIQAKDQLPALCGADVDIFICISAIGRTDLICLVAELRAIGFKSIFTLPEYPALVAEMLELDEAPGKVGFTDHLRSADDWLGFRTSALAKKNVVISGGGGSIGSRVASTALLLGAAKIVVVDINEESLFDIRMELERLSSSLGENDTEMRFILGDVACDWVVELAVDDQTDIFVHAAAYKHVAFGEENHRAVLTNNIMSTRNCLSICEERNVKSFVLVSTDKAVRPTNVMGFSKRVCEEICRGFDPEKPSLEVKIVRFGNVLGSSGSVVPIFKERIKNLEPLIVRDFRLTRYFMTIEQAAELIIDIALKGDAGQTYLLDMGEARLIYDLAKIVARLEGYSIKTDGGSSYPILEGTLGVGEKIHEELSDGSVMPVDDIPGVLQVTQGDKATTLADVLAEGLSGQQWPLKEAWFVGLVE